MGATRIPVAHDHDDTTTAGDDDSEDPAVDPDDAGFPSSPDLDDGNTVFTGPGANDDESGGAGLG